MAGPTETGETKHPAAPPAGRDDLGFFRTRPSRTWLTIGLSLVVFALVAADVACGGLLARSDPVVLTWLRAHEPHALVRALAHTTKFGAPVLIIPVAILVAMLLLVLLRWADLIFWAVGFAGSWGITMGLKNLFARPRPVELAFFQVGPGYTFPSGHTMAAVVAGGLLGHLVGAALAQRWPRSFVARHGAALLGLGGGGAVGIAVIAVCVHYPTDVVGALAIGWAWVLLCIAGRKALGPPAAVIPAPP